MVLAILDLTKFEKWSGDVGVGSADIDRFNSVFFSPE